MNQEQMEAIVRTMSDEEKLDAAGMLVHCNTCNPTGVYIFKGFAWELAETITIAAGNPDIVGSTDVVLKSNEEGGTLTFMAHNLGADTSLDPSILVQGIHGNYYQWGIRNAVATAYTDAGEIPSYNTIEAPDGAWKDTVETSEDPCPSGYKVPSAAEWEAVITHNTISKVGKVSDEVSDRFNPTNFAVAIVLTNPEPAPNTNTQLILPYAGSRNESLGNLELRGRYGYYWTSSEETRRRIKPIVCEFNYSGNYEINDSKGVYGFSVRCVKIEQE